MPIENRGWKFVMPELAEDAPGAGPQIAVTGTEMVEGAQAVRQAILMLLRTHPGERVMRPAYGCALHRLIFAPNDDTTAGLAIHYVRQALERWETRVEIVQLDASRDAQRPEALRIQLDYRVCATRQPDTLVMSLDLHGG